MSHTAVIKFAPLQTLERHNDPYWTRPGRILYETGSLKFAPGVTEIPLLVDHDDERSIGTVHEIFRMEWVDGPWMCARASVDYVPAWLRKHATKASFGFSPLQRRHYTENELIARAIVNEISVLSPAVKPAEPLAEVLLLKRQASPAAGVVASDRTAAGEQVFYGGGAYGGGASPAWRPDSEIVELHRRLEWIGPTARFETVLENMKRELLAVR